MFKKKNLYNALGDPFKFLSHLKCLVPVLNTIFFQIYVSRSKQTRIYYEGKNHNFKSSFTLSEEIVPHVLALIY